MMGGVIGANPDAFGGNINIFTAAAPVLRVPGRG